MPDEKALEDLDMSSWKYADPRGRIVEIDYSEPEKPIPKQIQEEKTIEPPAPILNLKTKAIAHDKLAGLELPEPEWLIPMMIPFPGMVAISGRPGSYKTFFSMFIALSIAKQKELFSIRHDGTQYAELNGASSVGKYAGVLFIEDEMVERQMHARTKLFEPAPDINLQYLIGGSVKMSDKRHRKEILEHMEVQDQKCLVLDPFSSVAGFKDENDNAEVAPFMDMLRQDFVSRGITVIIVHHPSKGDDSGITLRGAGDITGKVDEHIVLKKDDKQKDEITVGFAKTRDIDPMKVHDFKMRFGHDTNGFRTFEYLGWAKKDGNDESSQLDRAAQEATERFPDLSGDDLIKKAKEIKRDLSVADAVKKAVATRPKPPYVPMQ